ncbi:MAG: DeoR/GlpR transcriptional regulator [Actinobacteria bacterium]|nr:DeoR/GlpR transcriptional regulator [Actinomycetota bacterium]
MTINRDLRKLHKEGKLIAVRGGAMRRSRNIPESYFSQRINANLDVKHILAEKAIKYVKPGDSIILDSSTTAIILCRRIVQEGIRDLTIITNSNTIIHELASHENITVISTGGMLLSKFQCLVGPLAELLISQVRVNKFFFSVAGVSINGELTDTDIQEVNVKKKMMEVANKKILLVGSHKFNKVALYKVADIESLDLIISDGAKGGEAFLEAIRSKGIEVVV